MDHFYEMSCSGGPTMQITFFCGAANLFTSGCAINVAASRRKSFENWIEMFYDIGFSADHFAITAFESPHAPARSDIDIVNALGFELTGTANVINVVRIAAIDDDVILLHASYKIMESRINNSRRNHQPYGARSG